MQTEGKTKILVVDDDPVTLELLGDILRGCGYEVALARDGQEGWDLFRKRKIKFIIADWLMPVMDGLALCRKIRSMTDGGYVYFILLTAKVSKDDIITGLDAGADDYVTKPFDRNELKIRIQAGQRILDLERELVHKNKILTTLNMELEALSRVDPLMSIGNRRSFIETVAKVHHRACRYERGYGLIMCDIDNFKSYNDLYGHLSGDGLLKKIAESIKKSLRVSDDVFRYGGEEIVILLPEQNLSTTRVVAERIRGDIESMAVEHKGSVIGVITVSCGVAAFDRDCTERSWESVLKRADVALYAAKSAGRNHVACSEDR